MQELWILVISRMAHLIYYEIIMGPIRFLFARAHGMIKPALPIAITNICYNHIWLIY